MPLTEAEIRQVQVFLDLSVEQLYPNSTLRQCIQKAEDNDTRFGLTVITDVQNNLVAIADLNTRIENIKGANTDAYKRTKIDQEQEVEYRDGVDSARGLKGQRANLIARIAKDLNIYHVRHSARKLRS